MARQIPSGTPTKSSRHVFPDDSRRLLQVSLALGAALAAGFGLLYILVGRSVVSPGKVAAAHSHIDAKCSLCHDQGRNMLRGAQAFSFNTAGNDLRCERCHDTSGAGRLTNASHVLLGSGDPLQAAQAPLLPCAQCHVDHRGAQASLRGVNDRECATCHSKDFPGILTIAPLTSFARHPEFAAFKARRTTGVGLLFNHVTHFDYVLRERRKVKDVSAEEAQRSSVETCDRCHATTRDRREFVPVSFETGCAGSVCHTDRSGLINEGTRDVTVAFISQVVPGAPAPAAEGDDQVKAFSGIRHRDEWIQFNAAWLGRSLDPAGSGAERAALRSSLAWLDQQSAPAPWQAATIEDLTRWQNILTSDIADLDGRLAAAGRSADEFGTLARDAAEVQKLLAQINPGAADPQLDADVGLLTPTTPPPDDNPVQLFEARRRELLTLLTAVRARAQSAGDATLRDRALLLEARIKQATPDAAGRPPDLAALRRELSGLNDVVRAVRQTNDRQAQSDLAALQALRDFTLSNGLGGLPAAEFEQRRQEVLRLLDAISTLNNADVQQRIADLRARVVSLRPNGGSADDLRNRRAERERTLGRVRLELELAGSPDRATPLPAPLGDDSTRRLADDLRQSLARLDFAATAPVTGETDRAARQQTLSALLAPCLKCHLYEGEDENRIYPVTGPDGSGRSIIDALSRTGLRLSRVSAAEPVLKRAVFAHGPHLVASSCANCHASLNGSTLAIEFNSPGVATCQTCHTSSGARTRCASCHIYHPPSGGRLLQSVWSGN